MQNTLTRVPACGWPSARQVACEPVAGKPVSVMVVASGFPNAPECRCSQCVNGSTVHSLSMVQACAGGPWNAVALELPQKPQKTFWLPTTADDRDVVPVVRLNGIGRAPMYFPVIGGGQSWLVG